MARVLALVPDLLFGSKVQGALAAAGHEVELITDEKRLRERLSQAQAAPVQVLVLDLSGGELDGSMLVHSLTAAGALADIRTLGFFSHVETEVRERAEQAGVDLVVPRSRMAREGAALVTRLAAAPPAG